MQSKRSRNLFRIVTLLCALFMGVTGAVSSAYAANQNQLAREKTVFTKVFKASNREAAYQALSPADKALFVDAFKHQTPVLTASHGGALANAQAKALGLKPAAVTASTVAPNGAMQANAAGCWYWYYYYTWNDFFLDDGRTWFQLNWCGNGSSITSWSVSQVGCQGLLGTTCKGIIHTGSNNVGWEIRRYEMWDFSFYGYADANPCLQIRGGASGLQSHRPDCNLG